MRKIYSLLLLGGLLFFGVQRVNADGGITGGTNWGSISNPHHFYLDDSKINWYSEKDGDAKFVGLMVGQNWEYGGGSAGSTVYPMDRISNTKLYYVSVGGYSHCNEFLFIADDHVWETLTYYPSKDAWNDGTPTKWGDNGKKWTNAYCLETEESFTANYVTLSVPASSDNCASISLSPKNNSAVTSLNTTQTVKYAVANNAGSYVDMNSGVTPAAIGISSYKFVEDTYDAVSASNGAASLIANSSTYATTFDAAHTATTTLTMSNLSDDYEFVGWYDGTSLHTGNSYTYYPTEATTITARFRLKKYTREVTNGKYGTICLPRAVSSVSGAALFEVAGYRGTADNITSVVLKDASTPLVAGKPYIFQATASSLVATYDGDFVNDPVAGDNGLIGKFEAETITANGTSYILRNNEVCKVVDGGSGVTCSANRAYFDFNGLNPVSAPGVREIPMAPSDATNIQNINDNENIVKFIENGKLLIRKDGVVYDVTGRIVK